MMRNLDHLMVIIELLSAFVEHKLSRAATSPPNNLVSVAKLSTEDILRASCQEARFGHVLR